MDFFSHILIGLILSEAGSLTALETFWFVLGSVIADISVLPVFWFHGFKDISKKHYATSTFPAWIENFYYSTHSFFLVAILMSIGYFVSKSLVIFSIALAIHIFIDAYTHKQHAPKIFFPFSYRVHGFVEWGKSFCTLKSRVPVWAGFVIILLIVQ